MDQTSCKILAKSNVWNRYQAKPRKKIIIESFNEPLASRLVLRLLKMTKLWSIKMKKLGIVALLLSLSACGSIGGYSLNPMDYLGGSSDTEEVASE